MLLLLLALQAAQTAVPAAPKDLDPVVCLKQSVGDEVGTRIHPKKICMKKSDRAFIEQQAKQTVQNYNNRGDDRMRTVEASPR